MKDIINKNDYIVCVNRSFYIKNKAAGKLVSVSK